jgi:hypothetical protein
MAYQTRDSLSSGRLHDATRTLAGALSDPGLRRAFLRSALEACVLLATALVLIPRRRWAAVLAATAPLAAVTILASAIYASSPPNLLVHGLGWPPRFVLFWSVACAGLLVAAYGEGRRGAGVSRSAAGFWAAVTVSFAVQGVALQRLRGEDVVFRTSAMLHGSDRLVAARLSVAERSFLACLRNSVPESAGVVASGGLFAYFDRHDLVWPDNTSNALRGFRLVVCETKGRLPFDYGCAGVLSAALTSGFRRVDVAGISVAHDSGLTASVARCERLPAPG